jgi:hypothetical protein
LALGEPESGRRNPILEKRSFPDYLCVSREDWPDDESGWLAPTDSHLANWKSEDLASAREIQTASPRSALIPGKCRTVPIREVQRFGEKSILQPLPELKLTGGRILPASKTQENGRLFGPFSISKYETAELGGGPREIQTHGTVGISHLAISHYPTYLPDWDFKLNVLALSSSKI